MDVDDQVRYPALEGKTWYARYNDNLPSMWGVLIEKAWAKSFSNYKSLDKGGFSVQAFRALTGAPTIYY